jgi:hypothetical protein
MLWYNSVGSEKGERRQRKKRNKKAEVDRE